MAQQATDQDRNAKKAETAPFGVSFSPGEPVTSAPADASSRIDRLRWNLRLVEGGLAHAASADVGKLAALSKQHAALLEEIDALEKTLEPARDALDDFLGAPNVVGISTAASRMQA
jgi:hypothetical protein